MSDGGIKMSQPAEDSFEQELFWCIEQLQQSLDILKPSSKQAEDASRYLKVLLSAKAPLIKKRQAMRNAFGDYRKKMQEMERKSTAVAKRAKLSSGEVGEGKGQKSLFFKRSLAKTSKSTNSYVGDHLQNEPDTSSPASVGNQSKCTHSCESNNQSSIMQSCDNSNQSSVGKEGSGDVDATNGLDANFKFNFTISDDNDPDSNKPQEKKDKESIQTLGVSTFKKSDNSFKFNFDLASS
ncbi:UPF0488 protein CG14286-like [Mya arenaria]|uniref:UPF0488 protein CG14286-like n=1 Tax=Mya arenaria TaxID=6604 RepID=UPI0022E66130|nr:UPF0488 protein CG14286-like [Mya arenaria]